MINEYELSGLRSIRDTLFEAQQFLVHRDQMNATLHMDVPRWSPLTSKTIQAYNLLDAIITDIEEEPTP